MLKQATYNEMFRKALLIRRVEEKIIDLYPTDKVQSPVHLSIGQEAVSVGLCASVGADDLIFGSYRSHALYIACGGDLTEMFAELMGRVDGVSKGKAGSMHLTYPKKNFMGSSAVVASHLPHAVGAALAAKHKKTDQVMLCVFGDGSLEEGVVHECFNFAALKKLPVLFVCENNSLAVHSMISDRQSFSIAKLADLYGIPYTSIPEGYDFMKVHTVSGQIMDQIRSGGGPQFIEIKTYRSKEHVGPGDDFNFGYRSRDEFEAWCAKDPLIQDKDSYEALIGDIDALVEQAVARAEQSPFPGAEELLTDVI